MRILSQDGLIFNDIPYEKFVLGILKERETDKFCIVARKDTVGESGFPLNGVMAKYSTEAKVRKAMEMLHGKYSTLRMQKVIDRNVNQAVYERIKNEDKEKFFTALFQFPSDDELEVSEC